MNWNEGKNGRRNIVRESTNREKTSICMVVGRRNIMRMCLPIETKQVDAWYEKHDRKKRRNRVTKSK